MFKCRAISEISYLTESAKNAETAIGYYTDSSLEPAGRWWSPKNWIADRSIADAAAVTRLSQGRHPVTGRAMVAGNGTQKRAGFDCTFSSPKSFSALWAVSGRDDRRRLESMIQESVRETLDQIFSEGLIEARRGKGGRVRETVAAPVAAIYMHRTSRDGDPQLHCHAALLNFALRNDDTIGAVNNEKIMENQLRIGAAFRLRLSQKLENAGVSVVSDAEHGFKIEGMPDQILNLWSKRRAAITQKLEDSGIEQSAGNAEAADAAALATRGPKSALPPPIDLAARWATEAQAAGYRPGDPWTRMDRPAIARSEADERAAAKSIVAATISKICKTQSLFERREIEAQALNEAVGRTSAAAIGAAIDTVLASPAIVAAGKSGLFTTRTIVAQEREIVQIARSRQAEPQSGFSQSAINTALEDTKFSTEQRDAIRYALGPTGVAVVEGGPGVGKTTCSSAIVSACVADKRNLILAAPSWTAAEILKTELNCTASYFAVDKLLHDLKSNKLVLNRRDVILIDEAGMCSNQQILALLRAAARAGASVRLQGDSRQVASVSRGDPLSLISRAVGSAEIRTIRRQKTEWMRAASMAAQAGKIAAALAAYSNHGAVTVTDGPEAAIEAAAVSFRAAGGQASAIASSNRHVSALNSRLRDEAAALGLLTGPEVTIRSIPRGQKPGQKPEIVDLKLRAGDRLILGGEVKIGDETLRNAARIVVDSIDRFGKIRLSVGENRILETTVNALQRSGRQGGLPVIQHSYAVTVHAAQGATWSRSIWVTGREDSRSALVALTRHTNDLSIVIDRSAVPTSSDSSVVLDRSAMADPDDPDDGRGDSEVVAAVGKKMQNIAKPRNSLDIIGLRATGQTVPRSATMPDESVHIAMQRRRFFAPPTAAEPATTLMEAAEPQKKQGPAPNGAVEGIGREGEGRAVAPSPGAVVATPAAVRTTAPRFDLTTVVRDAEAAAAAERAAKATADAAAELAARRAAFDRWINGDRPIEPPRRSAIEAFLETTDSQKPVDTSGFAYHQILSAQRAAQRAAAQQRQDDDSDYAPGS